MHLEVNAAEVVVVHGADGLPSLVHCSILLWGTVELLNGLAIVLTQILKVAFEKESFRCLWEQ